MYGHAFISDGHGQSQADIAVVEQVSGGCVLLRVFSDGKQNQARPSLCFDSIIFRRFCRKVEPPFFNRRISTGSTDTAHTVTGLDKGATYLFEVRAVNRVEATPMAPEPQVFTLDFPHFANGGGITSEVVLLNVGTTPILPVLYFSDQRSASIDADSVVEVTDDQEALEDDGWLTVQKAIEPLEELTISTHGRGEELSGSVKVVSEGAIGGVLRYRVPGVGVTGVGAGRRRRCATWEGKR